MCIVSTVCFEAINKKCNNLCLSEDRRPASVPFGTRTVSAHTLFFFFFLYGNLSETCSIFFLEPSRHNIFSVDYYWGGTLVVCFVSSCVLATLMDKSCQF